MKEEEMEKGDSGPPTRQVFFEILSANVFDSGLWGDKVPLGSSPTKSLKNVNPLTYVYTRRFPSWVEL